MVRVSLTTHRAAVAGAFAVQAFVFITLTTRLPVSARTWDLGPTGMSLLLLVMVLLSGAGSVLSETVAARAGSASTLRAGLLLISVAVPVIVLAPTLAVGAAGLAAYGLGLGAVDASTNMQATALEHRLGRPVLPSFHGAWTVGGILGALLALTADAWPEWLPAAVAVLPLLAAFAPYLPGGEPATVKDVDAPAVAVPWRPILMVGVAMMLFYTVDIAAQTWGATFAHGVFGVEGGSTAAGVFGYLLASGLVRLAGDQLVMRYGPVAVLRTGAVVAALGLGLVVGAPTWGAAIAGFVMAGAGLAVVAPLSFSAAARLASASGGDRSTVDAVIARFNLFNYAGALLGSVLTGLVGGAGSLRYGFVLPALGVLLLLPLAASFVVPGRARDGEAAGATGG